MPAVIDPSQPTKAEILDLKMNSLKAQLASQIATEIAEHTVLMMGPPEACTIDEVSTVISGIAIETANKIVEAYRPPAHLSGMIQ